MVTIHKDRDYYILYDEIVEKVEETDKDGYAIFKGVTFPKTSWKVPIERAEKIEGELNIDTFIDDEIENNKYIENAEVYLNGRICAVYNDYNSTSATLYNELLQSIPVTSLDVDEVDGTILYYFKSE